jgi:hypothetical protein
MHSQYCVLLIWVFLTAYIYRTLRPVELRFTAGRIPDFDISKSRLRRAWLAFAFHPEIHLIEIGFPLPPAGNLDEPACLQLLDVFVYPRDAHAHVAGKPFLAGKAAVVVPSEMQEHRVRDLGPEADVGIAQDEIGNLGKAAARDRIIRCELDVAFSENVADVTRLLWHRLIVARRRERELWLSPKLCSQCPRAMPVEVACVLEFSRWPPRVSTAR